MKVMKGFAGALGCIAALALTAALVAALPGLWTLLLSGKPPKRPRE